MHQWTGEDSTATTIGYSQVTHSIIFILNISFDFTLFNHCTKGTKQTIYNSSQVKVDWTWQTSPTSLTSRDVRQCSWFDTIPVGGSTVFFMRTTNGVLACKRGNRMCYCEGLASAIRKPDTTSPTLNRDRGRHNLPSVYNTLVRSRDMRMTAAVSLD